MSSTFVILNAPLPGVPGGRLPSLNSIRGRFLTNSWAGSGVAVSGPRRATVVAVKGFVSFCTPYEVDTYLASRRQGALPFLRTYELATCRRKHTLHVYVPIEAKYCITAVMSKLVGSGGAGAAMLRGERWGEGVGTKKQAAFKRACQKAALKPRYISTQ
jgi:hypothetical protein